MDIQSLSNLAARTPTAAAAERSSAALTADFDTFLQMLTAQARYQDPLEPIDSTEYAAQLAQFSMVEQQVKTNESLMALAYQMGQSGFVDMSGWVGMEARAVAPVAFEGQSVTITPWPDGSADEAFLVVMDANGDEVSRLPIPVSNATIEWRGETADGALLPVGQYSFAVESRRDGDVLNLSAAEVYSRVAEAQCINGQTVLILAGGHAVLSDAVTGIREPQL